MSISLEPRRNTLFRDGAQVGPATASAVLSVVNFNIPFMSDEALVVVLGDAAYTLAAFEQLQRLMASKAAVLNKGRASPAAAGKRGREEEEEEGKSALPRALDGSQV